MSTHQLFRQRRNSDYSQSEHLIHPAINVPEALFTGHSQYSRPTICGNVERHVFNSATSGIDISAGGTRADEIYRSISMRKSMLVTSPRHDYRSFQADWDTIQRTRLDILGLRSRVHEMRHILRQKQLAKSEADDRYMLRVHADELGIVFRGNGPSLLELRNQCREARDEYGRLENDCIDLEDKISNQESQLARLEQRLYSSWHLSLGPSYVPGSPQAEENPQISYHSFDIEETQSFYHPLVTQYLSKLGDLDIIKERLNDLLGEKTALEAEKETRKKFNINLDLEDQAWLDDSERMGHKIYEQLQRTDTEYQDLRSQCVAEGLVDENGDPSAFQELEKAQFRDEKNLKINGQTSEYVKFPLLIPLHPANDYGGDDSEYNSDHGQAPSTSSRRVNEWILRKLRSLRSFPLDVQLLAELQKHIHDDDHAWQRHVLSAWFKDETNRTRVGSREPSYESSVTSETSVDSEDSDGSTGL
ncbi:hypothetical protein CJF32_00008759 [Rutstroemia sp. NJR-2017a WRK4]|nr:hypothetical protein CJF32_00008759 [Rutstroemia sp. NJR-2017a WRK4]